MRTMRISLSVIVVFAIGVALPGANAPVAHATSLTKQIGWEL